MDLLLELQKEKTKQNEIVAILQKESLDDLHSVLRAKNLISGFIEQEIKIDLLIKIIAKL